MRRFLQLAGNVALASSRNNNVVNSSLRLGLAATQRPISISSAYAKKYDGSSSSSSSSSGGRKKKGLLDIASETISNIGSKKNNKSRSSSTGGKRERSPNRSKKLGSPPATYTSAGKKSGHGLSGASNKAGQTQSGYDTRKAKGSMSREKSPLSQNRKSGRGDGDKYRGPKDHRSLGSVRHDKGSHRFILDLGDNQVARIEYKPVGNNKIELYYTEVPVELRGRGIGKSLAKGALECAAKDNYKIKVTCEYLKDYIRRFAGDKYKKLIEH